MSRNFPLVVGLLLVLALNVNAQPRGGSDAPLLKIGSKLPDVKLYDDAGKEFSTTSLRGNYTVLVFGCLT